MAIGKTVVRFVSLSPYIKAKSIQVKAEGELMVQSVNYQKNYLEEFDKSKELMDLESKLEIIKNKIELENTHLGVIRDEIKFLNENRSIGGKNESLNLTSLKEMVDFYRTRLSSLRLKEVERNRNVEALNDQLNKYNSHISGLSGKKNIPSGEVLVQVDVKQAKAYTFELSYLVDNASWFPSYDIRAKSIDEPLQLIYKANLKQNTKVDWKNVKLKFSSAEPKLSGVAPGLKTYILNCNTLPPRYKSKPNTVSGKIVNRQGDAVVGTMIFVKARRLVLLQIVRGIIQSRFQVMVRI